MEQEQPIETEEQTQLKKKKTVFIFSNSFSNFLLHLVLVIIIGLGAIYIGFNVYLPSVTNHDETITVPLLTEMKLEDAQKMLEQKNLRSEIIDSVYRMNLDAGVIIDQTPAMNAKVKLNRKIYLTVSSAIPPKISIPNIIDKSVKYAELTLRNSELRIGKINYIDKEYQVVYGVVYNADTFNTEDLNKGIIIEKGSTLDLVVGNGLGETSMDVPNVIGMDYEEAQTLLRGVGLTIGTIDFVKVAGSSGLVTSQQPEAGTEVQIGEIIELSVSEVTVENIVNQDSTNIQ